MSLSVGNRRYIELVSRLTTNEAISIAVGVIAFVVGVIIDVFVLRLVCLVVVIGSAVLVYASLRAKQLGLSSGLGDVKSPFSPQSGSDRMKKLVFDDFQIHAKGAYLHADQENDEIPTEDASIAPQQSSAGDLTRTSTYSVALQKPAMSPTPQREFQVSDFFDVDSDIYRGESEPRTEFDFLLNKVLAVIKEVLFAHTVAFFWANREKQQMVLEARATDSTSFLSSRRFPIGHDLVSKVARTGKPEFVTEVNPVSEPELLCYYETPAGVKSFIGVPVFFARGSTDQSIEQPVAVLAVDSRAEDEFGEETLILLGQFTKLISALIKSYNDKYDLLLDSELLSSIRRLQERIRNNFTVATVVQVLSEETSRLINWDFLSVVLYDEGKHAWLAKKVINRGQEGYVRLEHAIDFPESVVGRTIRTNTHCIIDDLETLDTQRYFADEQLNRRGSFVSVPISSLNKCYGAINLESRDAFNFSRRDVEMLYRLADNAASALEILFMQEVIHEYVIVDDVTGTCSKKFFLQRMEEELQRADDAGSELSLLFVTVDKSAEIVQRFTEDGLERVMVTLAKAIRTCVRPYDIVGRYDRDRFGVLLVNTAANEAYLWAEKIRKNIASLVITIDGRNFSITISVGVCGALEGMKKEELLGNTTTVLNKASEAGGNVVRVF